MNITITTEDGQLHNLEVDATMELENVMALLEVEAGLPKNEQEIFHLGKQLEDPTRTLESFGVGEGEVLLLTRKATQTPSASTGGRNLEQETETLRQEVLGNPQLREQISRTNPDLLQAAQSDPARFRHLISNLQHAQQSASLSRQHYQDLLSSDPYDVEAQRRIEEAIQQEAITENMEAAMEYSPESFARVTMLYVDVEVNGKPVKAFVDSGAQATIMSPTCAEACGITRLIDTRFSGIARGVGTARILGRVHSAQIKVGSLFLHCSFTIMEGQGVDLLFGLDMLKRHQACIDLGQNALIIQEVKVPFLAEHELPESARFEAEGGGPVDANGNPIAPPPGGPSGIPTSPRPGNPRFPGAGNLLSGSDPPSTSSPATEAPSYSVAPQMPPAQASGSAGGAPPPSRYPEKDVQMLIGLGVKRDEAITMLDTAQGNAELAASLLFNQFD